MTWNAALPVAILLSSLLPGVVIFFLPESATRWRTSLNILGAGVKVLFVLVLLLGVQAGERYETRWRLLADVELVLHADALSVLFVSLSAGLWFLTTLYAVGYLEGSPNRGRFFGFFSLCVSASVGVAMAGNLITLLLFYESLTLVTYPLVVHRGTEAAMRAGAVYLRYTLPAGGLLLIGVAWLHVLTGPADFAATGSIVNLHSSPRLALTMIFWLLIVGFGVKAALVPLHGWLPTAMIAPAPVSALLHAVAVVKSGAFGIIRVVLDVFGAANAEALGVMPALLFIVAATIVYGSLRALQQDELKRRLAYSTVSQVSYIALGVAIGGPIAALGGIAHLVHQGLMKITLFFCAGNLAETLGIHHIHEMRGVGRRMPWTMAAFTVASFGMIGVPPTAGFVSKWYLAAGGLARQEEWIVMLMAASSLLNAGYFLPIVYRAWFVEADGPWPEDHGPARWETSLLLLVPTVVTAMLALLAGLLAGTEFSPLAWARLIVAREFP